MVRRISFFICSCFLLLWTGPGGSRSEEESGVKTTSSPSVTESQNTSSSNTASDVATSSTTSASPSRTSSVATSSTTSASPSRPTSASLSPDSLDNASSVATSPTTSTLPSRSTASPKQTTVIVNNPINTSSPTLEPNKSITSSPTGKQSHNRTSTSHPTSQPATSKAGLGDKAMLAGSDKNYLWILVPVLIVALAAMIYLKFKCKKVQSRPEMADIGTENASFQRTDSNKDGVMLLGVSKTSVGEDNEEAEGFEYLIVDDWESWRSSTAVQWKVLPPIYRTSTTSIPLTLTPFPKPQPSKDNREINDRHFH